MRGRLGPSNKEDTNGRSWDDDGCQQMMSMSIQVNFLARDGV